MGTTLLFAILASLFTLSTAYTWPDPQIDDLESFMVQVTGFDNLGFADAVQPCGAFKGANNTGRQTAAEWLRIAFHDMATYDVTTGLGGLDASIGYETSRPENIGAAMTSSLQFFLPFMSARTSMSDLMALGTVAAMRSCGSERTSIPLRAGRIDATQAGPFGVPQPQEGIDVHTQKFAKQGFSVQEMIGLVACGHTIGGVHQEDFPDIVHNATSSSNQSGQDHFDATFDKFDNNVAIQWVHNKSQNVLAIGPNLTNSDKRIFNADGGSTMRQFASDNNRFLDTCTNLIERMINTVPRNVQLSEPIAPIPVKPVNVDIQANSDGSLQFSGAIRLIGSNSDRKVRLHYQSSQTNDSTLLPVDSKSGIISTVTDSNHIGHGFDSSFQFFSFSQKIPAESGIKSFIVEVQDGSSSRNETNGGNGFPMSDMILVSNDQSCVNKDAKQLKVAAFARASSPITTLSVTFTQPSLQSGTILPKLLTNTFTLSESSNTGPTPKGYQLYEGTTKFTPLELNARATFDVVGMNGGSKVASNEFNIADLLPPCQ